MRWLDDLQRDLQLAVRTLRRSPGFTAVAIVTLALGIGANTAIFSVVNGLLLQPLPYKNADRLVRMFGTVPPTDNPNGPARRTPAVQVIELSILRSQTRTLSHLTFYLPMLATFMGPAETVRLEGTRISSDAFSMLDAQPLAGRVFEKREESAGADAVVVLSHAAWQRYFDGALDVLGRNMTLDGRTYSVIGVMPPTFRFPDAETQFWIPLVETAFPRMGGSPIARLKDGVTAEAAAAEVGAILQRFRANQPAGPGPRLPATWRYELVGLQDLLVAPVRPALVVLTGAVGLVLLIACVNVANLQLARTAARQRDIAVRRALGAGRARLVRQALTEAVVLALIGAAAGTVLARFGVQLLQSLAAVLPRRDMGLAVGLPRLGEVRVDATVLLFTLTISIVTGALFGLAPALQHSRSGAMEALREGVGAPASGFNLRRRHRLQGLLVVVEIAMAIVLSIGGVLLIRSVIRLSRVDAGYNASHVLTAQVALPRGRNLTAFAEEMAARLRQAPRVQGAGYARQLPMVRMRQISLLRSTPDLPPPGQGPTPPPFDGRQLPELPDTRVVSRDYLSVMGVRLLAGRWLGEQDGAGHPQALLINRTLARSGLFGDNPIGKHIYALGRSPWEVVGVVDDVRQFDLDREADPQIYLDFRQEPPPDSFNTLGPPPSVYVAVRTLGDPVAAAASVRSVIRQTDSQATVDNFATMEQIVANSMSRPRLYAVLLGIFAAVAVTLAAIGIYGVMAYSVARRTREIGIRMALGAEYSKVVRLVLGESLLVTSVGVVGGVAGAAALSRYLGSLMFGIAPLDAATFTAVAFAFVAVAIAASYLPARRATKVDPLIALRAE